MNESAGSKSRLGQIAAASANVVRTLAARARVLWRAVAAICPSSAVAKLRRVDDRRIVEHSHVPSGTWHSSTRQALRWRRLGPAAQVTIVLALGFILLAWRYERRARVGEAARLALFKKQTDADIAQLRNQAASAVREAKAGALRVQSLEARRRKAEQAAEELRRHLVSLQRAESNEVKQVATLPTSEVAIRVAARLGWDGRGALEASAGAESAPRPLSEASLRKIETAFLELDACREQGTVKDQQVVNCREQSEANTAIIAQQNASIEKLNQALAAKEGILTRREAEHRAELGAARGSRLARLVRTLEHVGVGMVLGIAIR